MYLSSHTQIVFIRSIRFTLYLIYDHRLIMICCRVVRERFSVAGIERSGFFERDHAILIFTENDNFFSATCTEYRGLQKYVTTLKSNQMLTRIMTIELALCSYS
uniref:Uncharacterized protein n=1 Tax=Sipha flava TaxID=143950 RepID=A0A2S2R5N7_9HEMI